MSAYKIIKDLYFFNSFICESSLPMKFTKLTNHNELIYHSFLNICQKGDNLSTIYIIMYRDTSKIV